MERAPHPKRDSRQRVHRSALVYGLHAYFDGPRLHLSFHESMQRVVYVSDGGDSFVVYANRHYLLRAADKMKELVEMALSRRGSVVYILGTDVRSVDQFDAHEYIMLDFANDRSAEVRAEVEVRIVRLLKRYRKRRDAMKLSPGTLRTQA